MNALYKPGDGFIFFNEISKIDQLCTTLVGKVLPDGVHPSHFGIVMYLVRAGDGITPLSLAHAMDVSKATISHSIRVLEKRDFIKTVPCELDARSKQVFLTTAGRAFYEEALNVAVSTFNNFMREEDRQIMANAIPGLAAIRKLLEENREPPPVGHKHHDEHDVAASARNEGLRVQLTRTSSE